jgi:hypothetical protein
MNSKFAYLFLSLILISCGQRDKYREDYGTIVGTSLVISSKHVGGYGRSNCPLCHNVSLNVHRRVGSSADPEDVVTKAKARGSEYCLSCHTGNGL